MGEGMAILDEVRALISDKAKVQVIRDTVAPKTTDAELTLFLYECWRRGVNPLDRMIYAIKRRVKVGDGYEERMALQTSIDYLRSLSEVDGDFAGIDEIEFETDKDGNPILARCRVYRMINGEKVCFVGVARWKEFVVTYQGKPSGMWDRMPFLMLGKCAEAQARRLAWPTKLHNIYAEEELQGGTVEVQAEEVTGKKTLAATVKPAATVKQAEPQSAKKAEPQTQEEIPEINDPDAEVWEPDGPKHEPPKAGAAKTAAPKGGIPEGCTKNPMTCTEASWVDRKASCHGKTCKYLSELSE